MVALGLAAAGMLAWRGRPAGAIAERLTIGYAVEAPYAFVREDGEVTGEGPEIARVIAGRLGIGEVEWRQVEFSSLVPELRDGSIDVIAAGTFISPERAKLVVFSRPTFRVRPGLLVRKGNPAGLVACADLARSDRRVAVVAGSVEEHYFRGTLGLGGGRVLAVADAKSGVRAVQDGAVDALALSEPSLRWALAQMRAPQVELICLEDGPGRPGGASYGAFAFRREDRALRAAWDAELERFVGSGEHLTLLRRFGFGEGDLPERGAEKEGATR